MKFYQILPENQAIAFAKKASGMSWSSGKARTTKLTGTVKKNEEILDGVLLQGIGKRIASDRELQLDCIPLKLHNPKFSRYRERMQYHLHTDAPWMGETRTDLSCTLFLNDDYEGGELKIGNQKLRGKPGCAVVYDCGTPHEVLPVTSGERICVITWIQSRIRCPIRRKLVTDFRRFLSNFEDDPDLFVQGGQIHSSLIRMWME